MMGEEQNSDPFKICTLCGHTWNLRADFLSDPDVVLKGYQANFEVLSEGLFLFNHDVPNCRTALAIDVASLADLYTGPIFPERKLETAFCPGYCLHRQSLGSCNNECECAFIRVLLQIIRNWPKENRL